MGVSALDLSGSTTDRKTATTGPTRRIMVQVRVDEEGITTVHVAGNLDIYTASRLRQRMARFELASGEIVLDVSKVTLIDSAGLGTLMSFANRARRAGACLPLVCGPRLADVLEIARLSDAFELTLVPSNG